MIELILIAALAFGGGVYVGHETTTVNCLSQPIIDVSCPSPQPPINDTFGATTSALVTIAGQYRTCRAACRAAIQP